MNIQRGAQVLAADGYIGRVRHVVVDPRTREVTDIVVGQDAPDGREWLVPLSGAARIQGDTITLYADRATIYQSYTFDRDAYRPVDDEAAPQVSTGQAEMGSSPLRDAPDGAVEMGARSEVEPTQRLSRSELLGVNGNQPYRLQLREERLRVTKQQEQVGAVRVTKRVVEHLETLNVPVREERVVVERLPGAGRVMIGDRELQEGEVVEITVMREVVHVTKDVVPVEDVTIRKELVTRTEHIEDTVRREDLDIHQTGSVVIDQR